MANDTFEKSATEWKGLIWPCVFVLATLIVLLELGFWQLGRLAWKEDLIARVNERSQLSFAPPAPAESE
jgi:surfeit locus 1 family protein